MTMTEREIASLLIIALTVLMILWGQWSDD